MKVRVVDVALPGGSGGAAGGGGGGGDRNDPSRKERAPRPVARWERVSLTVGVFDDAVTPYGCARKSGRLSFGRACGNPSKYIFFKNVFCLCCTRAKRLEGCIRVSKPLVTHVVTLTQKTKYPTPR